MPRSRPYHVAIVGSGPSGFFAAAALLKAEDVDVRVDMLEMLPTPFGLVRSGVAPDHPKIKSISAQFEAIAQDPRFRFFGNVTIGEHVEAAELAQRYDAVIYAVGAQSDRPLGIPGEDLPGSVAAVDFVGWYNAHPHFGRSHRTCPAAGPSSSATAMSHSTSRVSWSPIPRHCRSPISPITPCSHCTAAVSTKWW